MILIYYDRYLDRRSIMQHLQNQCQLLGISWAMRVILKNFPMPLAIPHMLYRSQLLVINESFETSIIVNTVLKRIRNLQQLQLFNYRISFILLLQSFIIIIYMKKTKIMIIHSEEECEKKQDSLIPQPRRKRIQKQNTTKTKSHNLNHNNTETQLQPEPFPIQFIQIEHNNHNCPICLEIIVKSVNTSCGHSYCQKCLTEYLLFFEECLHCGKNLRNSRSSSNRMLDQMIGAIVSTMSEQHKKQYEQRYQQSKQYASNKKLKSFDVGSIIDVRDKDYIWCEARICRTICRWQQNRTKYVFITYLGKPKSYNQQICQHSERLAPHGFYSSRKDIVHYQSSSDGKLRLKAPLQFSTQQGVVLMSQQQPLGSE